MTERLRIVVFLWTAENYRRFHPEYVNLLLPQIDRNYKKPWELVCITDQKEGFDGAIRVVPIWDEFSNVKRHGDINSTMVNCFRRLPMFSEAMADIIAPRFVWSDIDMMILNDVTELWSRKEDFIGWNNNHPEIHYQGGMGMMNAGARKQVYHSFDPETSPKAIVDKGFRGSDQAWMSIVLGKGEAVWTRADGIRKFDREMRNLLPRDTDLMPLPSGATMRIHERSILPSSSEISAMRMNQPRKPRRVYGTERAMFGDAARERMLSRRKRRYDTDMSRVLPQGLKVLMFSGGSGAPWDPHIYSQYPWIQRIYA